jgi:two-component system sensor kinase FixL
MLCGLSPDGKIMGNFQQPGVAGQILASLLDVSEDAIVTIDLDGRVQDWNHGATRLYGYAASEMRGQPVMRLLPEGQQALLPANLARVRDGHRVENFETIRLTKDGRLIEVSATLSPIRDETGAVVGALSVTRDLRGQKRSDAALYASQARWRALLDSTVDGIVMIDARGRIEAFNHAAERLFGYTESELLGRNVSVLMPSPYREEHDGYLARYQREGDARIIGIGRQVTGRRRDGSMFPVHLSVGEMVLEGERKFTGILHDLSARVALEDQLRASEARWRAVIESAVDGIVVIDAEGHIEAFNPAAERLFGYSELELIGQNVKVLMPSPHHERHDGYLTRYLKDGDPRIIGQGREVPARRKDGSTFPVHLAVGEMRLGSERKFTAILHDLSSRVVMEAQLREQAALARLGEMAAVIAHEVKNPLAGIRGAMQVIGGRLAADSPEAAVTREIVARIDTLSELMKDLLLFARPPKPNVAPVELPSLIAATAHLLTADPALHGVNVVVEGEVPPVDGDHGLLQIVFVNLLANSAQAMKGRGTISVSVQQMNGTCEVAIRDDGPGIPPEMREKVFTPFFTTKSRGTGLGLPTAKRLIEAHQGQISIECPPEGGTTVLVSLPFHLTT